MTTHCGYCRCRSVTMHTKAEPGFTVFCHCDDCRRSTGAPVLASVAFPKNAVVWESKTTLATYGDEKSWRLFCNACGSPVAQCHAEISDLIVFNTGFMEKPQVYAPRWHSFAVDQLPWLEMGDDLPRYPKTKVLNR